MTAVLLLATVGMSALAEDAPARPDNAVTHDGKAYAFFAAEGIDAAAAMEACTAAGGALAAIPSAEVHTALTSAKTGSPQWAELWAWIDGKNCTESPPDWSYCWSDGSKVDLPTSAWSRNGQPSPEAANMFLRGDGHVAANPAYRGVPSKAGYLCEWADAGDTSSEAAPTEEGAADESAEGDATEDAEEAAEGVEEGTEEGADEGAEPTPEEAESSEEG